MSDETTPELLTIDEVARFLRISTKTLRRWSNEGNFPEPVQVGPRMLRWRLQDVRGYIDEDGAGGWEASGDAIQDVVADLIDEAHSSSK